jgi:nicotinamidase-related amidase
MCPAGEPAIGTSSTPADRGASTDGGGTALLLVDVINDLDFPEGNQLLKHALPAVARIAELKRRVKAVRLPVIYVNDNFGQWRSDFRSLVEHCMRPAGKGRQLAERLHPDPDDYFIVKPRHSGFYGTALEVLLADLGISRLILSGFAGDFCVLFTAIDAYMRHYELLIPADFVASKEEDDNTRALQLMRSTLRADIRESTWLFWERPNASAIGAVHGQEPTACDPGSAER